ncbi:MAG: WD40/YVTN/BNR-like repeat-containing protein, partial [Desulfobacterales bacterium]
MKTLFLYQCFLLLIPAISYRGFAQEWRSLGLENEPITVITVDWSNPEVIYAGSGSNFSAGTVGGIFKTTNGGASWDTLVRGVTVQDIDIHPQNPDILYATLGINGLTFAGIIKSLN